MKRVSRFLQHLGRRDLLENVSRKRKEGGLYLMNLTERIQAIKVKEIIEDESQIPATDNLIYAGGTQQNLIYGGKKYSRLKNGVCQPKG